MTGHGAFGGERRLQPTQVSAESFFSGLLAALALHGRRSVSITSRRFDAVVASVADELEKMADEYGLEVAFTVRPDPIHGTSSTVRECLSAAVQADLISLDNPEYQDMRIKISEKGATEMLDWLPGGEALYSQLAERFLHEYEPAHT